MLFTFFLIDKPGALAQRMELRPEHKAYLGAKAEQIAFAGPLLADDGKTMVGSLLVIDFASRGRAALACCRAVHACRRVRQHGDLSVPEPLAAEGGFSADGVTSAESLWPTRPSSQPDNDLSLGPPRLDMGQSRFDGIERVTRSTTGRMTLASMRWSISRNWSPLGFMKRNE